MPLTSSCPSARPGRSASFKQVPSVVFRFLIINHRRSQDFPIEGGMVKKPQACHIERSRIMRNRNVTGLGCRFYLAEIYAFHAIMLE